MRVFDVNFSDIAGHESGPYLAYYERDGRKDCPAYFTVFAPDMSSPGFHNPGYIHTHRPAVVLCPGGGYHRTSEREGEPVALMLCAAGACVFELHYSCTSHSWDQSKPLFPQPLEEVMTLVYYVRTHAEEYNIDPHNISVMGFSAGGHVAAMAATLWNKPVSMPFRKDETKMYRPDKMILGYPVILSRDKTHADSILRLMGLPLTEEKYALADLSHQIDAETPPCYLFHCENDGSVPIENSHAVEDALRKFHTYCECHYFPTGGHGGSLFNYLVNDQMEIGEQDSNSVWIQEAIRFMLKQDF